MYFNAIVCGMAIAFLIKKKQYEKKYDNRYSIGSSRCSDLLYQEKYE